MSCKSCGGCFTGSGCITPKKSGDKAQQINERFFALLKLASSSSSTIATDHDHIIPTITAELSRNNYSSQVSLLEAHNQLSRDDFLDLARLYWIHDIRGFLIAWTWEYHKGNASQCLETMHNQGDQKLVLWDYLDGQAEIHETFNGLEYGMAGRVKRSTDNQ
ncbi:hypothetical protein CLU79DRAFT_726971 [Phycomyces nitens]|nr:hypothetical protein CLU79DRAFT_726971 [Phycomyces nitens]